MNQQRVISVSLEEWEQLQEELRRLKQENAFMRKQLHGAMSPLLIRHRISVGSNDSHSPSPSKNSDKEKDRDHFQKSMQEWSRKIQKKVPSQQKTSSGEKKSPKLVKRSTLSPLSMSLYPVENKDDEEEQKQENEKIETNSQGKVSEKSNEEEEEEEIIHVNIESDGEQNKESVGNEKQKSKEQMKEKIDQIQQEEEEEEKCKLIECLCLYGPNWNQVEEKKTEKRMNVDHCLHYSSSKKMSKHFQVYGGYFYPEGIVACRRVREEENLTQVNQIIFRKNTKKQDCSLYMFQAQQNNKILKTNNEMMNEVNPSKWLVAFCVQFSDYHLVEVEDHEEGKRKILNKSFNTLEEHEEEKLEGKKSDRLNLSVKSKKTYCVKSKYTLCIFTYFPFINIIEQLLISILDEVKIRRVEQYALNSAKTEVTIHYFIDQIKRIGSEVMTQIKSIPPVISTDIHALILGHFKINFTFSRHSFQDLLYGGWVFDVVKMFDKDTLYEIFTNILMEESVCFVSENLHLLTHVIFLFITILPQPFSYPYPCISQMFNYELLDSPFVVTIGINENSKWLDENGSMYEKKLFIDLNEQKRVRGKRKPRAIKSEKLKKAFSHLYRKIESSSPIPQFLKKKGNIIKPASKQENDFCSTFLRNVKNYFQEEIIIHLPNPAIIAHIRASTQDDNETAKVFGLIKEVQKYLKESRKQKEKDQFVDLFVQQQTFYVYVSNLYNLH